MGLWIIALHIVWNCIALECRNTRTGWGSVTFSAADIFRFVTEKARGVCESDVSRMSSAAPVINRKIEGTQRAAEWEPWFCRLLPKQKSVAQEGEKACIQKLERYEVPFGCFRPFLYHEGTRTARAHVPQGHMYRKGTCTKRAFHLELAALITNFDSMLAGIDDLPGNVQGGVTAWFSPLRGGEVGSLSLAARYRASLVKKLPPRLGRLLTHCYIRKIRNIFRGIAFAKNGKVVITKGISSWQRKT